MSRLLFLSSTSCLFLAASGCSDDACGPPSGSQDAGLLASSADVVLNYGFITSGPNNDCGELPPSSGIVSLTLEGTQVDGPGRLTLCIRRPDIISKEPVALGTGVLIIDLDGTVGDCTYEYEAAAPVTGNVSTEGMCDNGKSDAGYLLKVDGFLSLRRMCPTMNDTIAVDFSGDVAIEQAPQI
jgi:hypothetical protein